MRWATLTVIAVVLAGCNDLRDFRGTWSGARVGEAAVVRVGVAPGAVATLTIDDLDTHGLHGTLTITGLVEDAPVESLPGAEADALSGMTFTGAPLRVYLSFVAVPDGKGEALALIALFDDHRIEARILRGGGVPLYAIFALSES
ncbi:hypothetical protein BH11MYX3_BH11MYX3_35980 [soil metagenome]